MTPKLRGITERTVVTPDNGWETGIYLVDVAYEPTNVIHRAILCVDTVEYFDEIDSSLVEAMDIKEKEWDELHSIHNWIHCSGYENPYHTTDVYYLKAVRKLCDKDELNKP